MKNVCKCGERAINPAPCEKREQAKRETANSQYRSYQRTAGIYSTTFISSSTLPASTSQIRSREEREQKRARMDGRHEFLLSTIAERLNLTMDEAEDFMLDGDQVRILTDYYYLSFFCFICTCSSMLLIASLLKVAEVL